VGLLLCYNKSKLPVEELNSTPNKVLGNRINPSAILSSDMEIDSANDLYDGTVTREIREVLTD
jgi:hypothetical protein